MTKVRPTHWGTRTALVALGGALLVAACSSSAATAPSTTRAATTTSAVPVTTATASSTTGVAATAAPVTTAAATTTTAPPAPTWPLTGLPADDLILASRPALAIKLDNHKDARPHAGINQADVVYEEIVEAQITRFFAIFHSTDAAPVGPIRSARNTDVDLLNQLNRPLFTYSGGNPGVIAAIGRANAESRAAGQAPGFYRDQARHARAAIEHTLLNTSTENIWSTIAPGQGTPPALFQYRPAGAEATGQPASQISLQMRSVPVHWTWDAGQNLWLREEYGAPHLDTTGAPVSANNVVVQFIQYTTSPVDARSPEGVTVGSGDALIFSGGKVELAHWDRPSADRPASFTAADGSAVTLTPGRTWVELAEAGATQVSFS